MIPQEAGGNKIGHYRQNFTPKEAKKGGIKSPDIIDEGNVQKNHGKFRIMAYYNYKHDNR